MVEVHAPHDRLDDGALLVAVELGQAGAATAFVRRFQRRVYGLALVITGDRATAEDVSQQAFERAWRHAGTYDPRRGTVPTWLLVITRNLAIDALRVRRPVPLDPAVLGPLLAPDRRDPGDEATTAARVRDVRGALRELPESQRRAVLLATVCARTSTEIAALEGVPVPTAKHRVQAGLRKLRALLLEEVDA